MKLEDYRVRDLSLAGEGRLKIAWAEQHMPVLMGIRREFKESRPLEGVRIGACLHITKETAVLAKTLMEAGAEVYLTASNPLSTQDDVAAALVEDGVKVYGFRGEDEKEYYENIGRVLAHSPHITIDDGADLVSTLHKLHFRVGGKEVEYAGRFVEDVGQVVKGVYGGSEETTTGVMRLRAMAREGRLLYPIIAVNDAKSKNLFDNPVGTGQSALDGVIRATNILLAGKVVVVAGFGNVGSGIAYRARGMGAKVMVVEVDPIKALKAAMDGFEVKPMSEAARHGDIFITATGNINVIRREHFEAMKDGAILANAGHFDVEISKRDLEALSVAREKLRPCLEKYVLRDGRRIYLLAEGRLVNLACAEGHPSEVMDMSFSLQALAARYIAENRGRLPTAVLDVPRKIDEEVARRKLDSLGVRIEGLTEEQERYLTSWGLGT